MNDVPVGACLGLALLIMVSACGDPGEPGESGTSGASAADTESDTGSGGADDSTGGEGDGAGGDPGACGRDVAGPEPSDPACGGVDAELIESPATQADAFFNRVLEADRFLLQGIVGQYACGQAPIYRGSLVASDNRGEACCGNEDGVMTGESVVGALVSGEGLEVVPAIAEGPHLFVFSPSEQLDIQFRQDPSDPATTFVSLVSGTNQSFGESGECAGCLLDLTTAPENVAIDVVAKGEYGASGGEGVLRVEAVGSLTRVAPQDVQWSDIVDVNKHYAEALIEIPAEFASCGNLLVRDFDERYAESAPAPPGSGWLDSNCTREVSYTARWWIDPADVRRHGVRDIVLDEPRYCCRGPDVGEGAPEQDCFEFEG